MGEPSDNGKPAFKVTDRRRSEAPPEEPAAVPPPPATPVAGQALRPAVDFSTFILSLASTALIQMGVAPHPETQEKDIDLDLARETIDLLGMLREKTRGNLSDEESKFFDAMLYDLRVRFVESQKKG